MIQQVEHLGLALAYIERFVLLCDLRQEQRGPVIVFSVSALPHVHFKADLLPQEHVA